MHRKYAITGGITAGIIAIAVAATPALAQSSPPPGAPGDTTGTCPVTGTAPARAGMTGSGSPGSGQGYGRGNGMRTGMRNGMGSGNGNPGQGLAGVASGTLSASQKASLATMAQEEKLARDLYVALAAKYPATAAFDRIARAETRHLTAVRALLTRYALADPTAGKSAGKFTSASVQSLYNRLLAGATNSAKALDAGATVEKADIADLTKAMTGVTAPDVLRVYTNLRSASQHHLVAFGG